MTIKIPNFWKSVLNLIKNEALAIDIIDISCFEKMLRKVLN